MKFCLFTFFSLTSTFWLNFVTMQMRQTMTIDRRQTMTTMTIFPPKCVHLCVYVCVYFRFSPQANSSVSHCSQCERFCDKIQMTIHEATERRYRNAHIHIHTSSCFSLCVVSISKESMI